MKYFVFVVLFYAGFATCAYSQSWQSDLVKIDSNNELSYFEDEDGFVIPDFSHAGYRGGGVSIPFVPVVKQISAITGDNTEHIQEAIDYVASLPLSEDGIRGALLLKAGLYEIEGSLLIKQSGIVIRGEGEGDDPATSTIIYAKGNSPYHRDVIRFGSSTQISGKSKIGETESFITDDVVPVGGKSFNVENPDLYEVGDRIIIYHPATQVWIDTVDMGGVPYPDPYDPDEPDERWEEGQLPILYNRFITGIEGNLISIDAPVFYSLIKSIAEPYIYKPNMSGLISEVGLENLRVDIENAGGTDEDHAWHAVRFKSCENAWAKNCTFVAFGQSGIITEACSRSSFIECSAIDPVAIVTGERMYNFNTYHYSQLNLFSHCYARNGRHHYMSNGTSTTSGNVFYNCISDAANSVNEGHRQWTQGMLYDNHTEINMKRDFVLGLYNRVGFGTGHGWAAVHSVLWNCDVDSDYGEIGLQKPPTAQNYAIGCMAKSITGNPVSASDFTRGYVEGQNQEGLEPVSLYQAQLYERTGFTSVNNIKPKISFELYPTLVDQTLYLRFNTDFQVKTIRIINLTGIPVLELNTAESFLSIENLNIPAGVYLLECRSEGIIGVKKFIKK